MKAAILAGLAAALGAVAMPIGAHAGQSGVTPAGVVELYTSQGCNSCPTADAVLAEIDAAGEALALAFHVDYWDYLGWKDTLARAENTERQRDYAKAFSARSVYTPQAVINGRTHVNGAKRNKIEAAIEKHRLADALSVDVSVRHDNGSLAIEVGAGGATQANVLLVYFDKPRTIEIDRGENRGRRITYVNPVVDFQSAGLWDGEAKTYAMPDADLLKKAKGGCAVLLQEIGDEGRPGPIIGAAVLKRP